MEAIINKNSRNTTIQIFRAFAIIAVVIIHTLPLGYWQVLIRPFVNFAVAAFLFLSGYLTKSNNENWIIFYKKRITRVVIPYVIWTLIYSMPLIKESGIIIFFQNLLTARAAGPLYFILVYIQFVLITPLICMMAKSRFQYVGWLISPVVVILYQIYMITTGFHPNEMTSLLWDNSFLPWFIFYFMGIILGNNIRSLSFTSSKLFYIYILSLAIQMYEGYWLNSLGYVNCGTQVKISSIVSSSIFCLIIYNSSRGTLHIQNRILLALGDYSFGIFLCHIMIIKIVYHIPLY